jgi:hypothetical protein
MNYIIVYLEIEHLLNFLTQEEKGDFLDLLIQYGKNQELPNIQNLKLLNVFNFMKGRLDTQFEKARVKAETARKNGAGGGRPSKPNRKPRKPKETQSVKNEELINAPNNLDLDFLFEEFWQGYNPVKTKEGKIVDKGSKQLAKAAYEKALKKYTADQIFDGTQEYLLKCLNNNTLTCQVSVMLNQERFIVEQYKTLNAK